MNSRGLKKYIFFVLFNVSILFLLKNHVDKFFLIMSYSILIMLYFIHFIYYENIPALKHRSILLGITFLVNYFIYLFFHKVDLYSFIFSVIYLFNIVVLFATYYKWRILREKLTFETSVPRLREVIQKRAVIEKDLMPLKKINNQLEEERVIVNKIFYQLKELNATFSIDKVIYIAYKDLKEILKLDNFILEVKKYESGDIKIALEENISEELKKLYSDKKNIIQDENILNYTSIDITDNEVKRINIFPLVINKDIIGRIINFEKDGQSFSNNKIKYIILVSHQIAMAIRKSLLYDKVQELSQKDGLTNLYLHRVFEEKLYEEYKRARRYKTRLSLIMLDIDHFKNVNDTYGHIVGDKILKVIAKVIAEKSQPPLLAARYGGEEFVVICPAFTKNKAVKLAEEIRHDVARSSVPVKGGEYISVTISAGVASLKASIKSADVLLKNADDALYKAKENGRNQVVTA